MSQDLNARQDSNREGTTGALDIGLQRVETARIAQQLSVVAFRSWEKALTGMFALPTALMVGAAATALYATAFVERAFELFESSVSDIGSSVARDIEAARKNSELSRQEFAGEAKADTRANELGQNART